MRDAEGRVVRRLNGPVEAGFHRVAWDLRFPPPDPAALEPWKDDNPFDVTNWRFGTGAAVQWFSPFGPIMLVLGFPLDRIDAIEDLPVFEFSVGGG